jgi:hypothetical protein
MARERARSRERAPESPQPARSTREMSPEGFLMWLQRTAGNQAVNRLLDATGDDRPPSLRPVVQGWWAGTRQLSGLGWMGKPWDLGGNPWDLGIYHKHIFLQDGKTPGDYGHMGPSGVGQDTEHSQDEYTVTTVGHNEALMRRAIARHMPAPPYKVTSENCQKWVTDVVRTYRQLTE